MCVSSQAIEEMEIPAEFIIFTDKVTFTVFSYAVSVMLQELWRDAEELSTHTSLTNASLKQLHPPSVNVLLLVC